jgi:hypothetical protein
MTASEPDHDRRYRLAADRAAAKVIDGEAIIIDLITGRYYSLEGPGADAWSLLAAGVPVAEVAGGLSASYEVDRDVALADTARLARQLLDEQLLAPADGDQPNPPELASAPERKPYRAPELTVFRDMEDLLAFDPPLPPTDTTVWRS